MKAQYGLATERIVPVRAEDSEKSEMVHQLLFGEATLVNNLKDNWLHIKILFDDYEGWVDQKMITIIDDSFLQSWTKNKLVIPQKKFSLKYKNDTTFILYPASEICLDEKLMKQIGFEIFDKSSEIKPIDFNNFIETLKLYYLNTPYLWGGRSPHGIDCSGFTQVAYKLLDIGIPRDASQQAISSKGREIAFIADAQIGDLAFFDNNDGLITHVGILINSQHIIHASGRVRVDNIDHQGIYNTEKEKYTHKLRLIKRFW